MKTFTYAAAIALAVGLTPLAASAQDTANEEAVNNEVDTIGVRTEADYGTLDANEDRMLDRDEYAAVGGTFGDYDRDQSGTLDEEEFTAWGEETWGDEYNEEQTAGLFEEWDDDADAQLTEDEFGDEEEFIEWDEDQSGALEEDEGWF
ncbi:hypothetical protein C882_3514 [Caenispirillum salinarum AK4]|uniref:EF-hand domain-containing protein n=1 Tax=Caenispirillum salinarum AK4 TaxID=1238182 RepID=K9HN67_9PROT|nr:hypothetical protein [Caenispirillum salinarum]EKV31763.1 hypothetical protein C882_3514 [Caenispirillum salinarum AK4]